jgi:hypothetical protein
MSQFPRQQRQAAHESAANPQNVYMHVVLPLKVLSLWKTPKWD